MRRNVYAVFCVSLAFASPFSPSAYDVVWSAPSATPGTTLGKLSTYADAMPLGNGAFTALAWANASMGGVGVMLGHQAAMSAHTELYKLGVLQIALSPNPFSARGFFEQRLDLSTASVIVSMGGTSAAPAATLRVWVDAHTDALHVDVTSSSPVSLTLTARSTRPATPWSHDIEFGWCGNVTSLADTFVEPLPPSRALSRARAQSSSDIFRHATGARRPLRTLHPLPARGAFSPATLISFHRNTVEEGETLNETLTQQGLASLIATTPDHWSDLTSGFAVDGGSSSPSPLVRVDARTLSSAAPGLRFSIRATALAVQTDTVDDFLADLAALVAAAPDDAAARAAHEAWWSAWWNRSHIVVNTTTAGERSAAAAAAAPGAAISSTYALTRYTQAVQSRGTPWPIKFNGGAFIAAMGESGEADRRGWGPSNWWQNTRLPYGNMLRDGDFDSFKVILDYLANQAVLLGQRTRTYFNHDGFWTTETTHLSGSASRPHPHLSLSRP